MYGSSGDADVINVAMVILGEDSGGGFVRLIYGLSLRLPTASHIRRGSVKIVKRKGESVSP